MSAMIDRQATQIAMLASVLNKVRECTPSGYVFEIVMDALTATQADVDAWEKSKRDAVLEEVAATLPEWIDDYSLAEKIRAMKWKL